MLKKRAVGEEGLHMDMKDSRKNFIEKFLYQGSSNNWLEVCFVVVVVFRNSGAYERLRLFSSSR